MANENYYNHRVRLVSVRDETNKVEFKVTPTFSEGRAVEYTPVTPIHMPGSIQVYKNTAARTFNIGALLVSRNVNEANDNMILLQTLRTWTLPFFGRSTTLNSGNLAARRGQQQKNIQKTADPQANKESSREMTTEEKAALTQRRVQAEGVELLGAPPMVLYLYAYSTTQNDNRGFKEFNRVNINRVPVVITNLTFNYPNDVDYFPAAYGGTQGVDSTSESFPTRMEITVDCLETHSPREYEQFSLQDFYNGKLVSF